MNKTTLFDVTYDMGGLNNEPISKLQKNNHSAKPIIINFLFKPCSRSWNTKEEAEATIV